MEKVMKQKELGFIIDEEENGYMHISWPHVDGDGSKKMATLSYWRPNADMKAKLLQAVFEEDFAELSKLWDIDEGSKGEDEHIPDFGEWSTKH